MNNKTTKTAQNYGNGLVKMCQVSIWKNILVERLDEQFIQ